jgi:phosphatidylglycerophosphatase C
VSRRTLAAFDFDGTLTRRDTLVPFLATIAGRASLLRALGAESPRLALAAAGRRDRDLVKERVLTRILGGRSYAEVEAAGRAFGAELTRSVITTAGRDRIADERGRCTGHLRGANCRGAEKAARLRALFGDDDVELWAYGNSRGDDEMLALAHHPVIVRRGRMPGGS